MNLLLADPDDTTITKPNSLFAEKVKALTQNQQHKIIDICKEKSKSVTEFPTENAK